MARLSFTLLEFTLRPEFRVFFRLSNAGCACRLGIPSGVPQLLRGILHPRVLDQVGFGQQVDLPLARQDEVRANYLPLQHVCSSDFVYTLRI